MLPKCTYEICARMRCIGLSVDISAGPSVGTSIGPSRRPSVDCSRRAGQSFQGSVAQSNLLGGRPSSGEWEGCNLQPFDANSEQVTHVLLPKPDHNCFQMSTICRTSSSCLMCKVPCTPIV